MLDVAVLLALPILIFGALLWILIYTAIRMALRHEIARAGRRKTQSRRTQEIQPEAQPRRPVAVRGNGQPARLRPTAHGSRDSRPTVRVKAAATGPRRAAS